MGWKGGSLDNLQRTIWYVFVKEMGEQYYEFNHFWKVLMSLLSINHQTLGRNI